MYFKEEHKDLFTLPKEYYLVQCISADFKMGAGIATQFNQYFNIKNKLINRYHNLAIQDWDKGNLGFCILEDKVFNLVTKRNYWLKSTYKTLQNSLLSMKNLIIKNNINKIAMPLIGCGLDRLEWNQVSQIIKDTFNDIDIEILICKKAED